MNCIQDTKKFYAQNYAYQCVEEYISNLVPLWQRNSGRCYVNLLILRLPTLLTDLVTRYLQNLISNCEIQLRNSARKCGITKAIWVIFCKSTFRVVSGDCTTCLYSPVGHYFILLQRGRSLIIRVCLIKPCPVLIQYARAKNTLTSISRAWIVVFT